jgi:hypothetical protein
MGIRPIVPRLRVEIEDNWSDVGITRIWATITINARDISWEELLKTYRTIRTRLGKSKRRLSPLHQRICEIVRERGPIPTKHGTKQPFWESIQDQLRKEKRFSVIPNEWRAIKKA